MIDRRIGEFHEAIASLRPTDTLAIPLGPGVPGGFLHALGDSTPTDRFVDLKVFGALLPDLFSLFGRPSVHLKSGFFGPAERFLRDTGADVDFVPADFRRFETVLHRLKPRVVAVAGSMPVDGRISLSLHCGAFTDVIAEVIADGSIHVYAPLRGKAIAGATGDVNARIFTTCMEPELISIAGIYQTTDPPLPVEVRGKSAQVRLDGDTLIIEPIKV